MFTSKIFKEELIKTAYKRELVEGISAMTGLGDDAAKLTRTARGVTDSTKVTKSKLPKAIKKNPAAATISDGTPVQPNWGRNIVIGGAGLGVGTVIGATL